MRFKVIISAMLALAVTAVASAEPKKEKKSHCEKPGTECRGPKAPRYIFYFIGDGMGLPHVINTTWYKAQCLGQDTSLVMTSMPVFSMAKTYSASSPVTDSAAAGTALSTGVKTRNGMLGMNPDTTAVMSIAKVLFDRGWGVGVLTSVDLDDATPGAFYAHVDNRSKRYEITRQLAESGYQFAAGQRLGGLDGKDGKLNDNVDYMAASGVKLAFGKEGLQEQADRLVVVNKDNAQGYYVVDSLPDVLTLPEMTRACIRQLERTSPDRWFMMVEGGKIDHAAHNNEGGTVIREVLAFDECIGIARDWMLAHPDETLIVITADHETGGMSVGNNTTSYNVFPEKTAGQRMSKDAFNDEIKAMLRSRRIYGWDDMEQMLRDRLGWWSSFTPTDEEVAQVRKDFEEMMAGRNQGDQVTLYGQYAPLTKTVFDIMNNESGLGFVTTKHTGSPVPVFAAGVGASRFSNMNNNIDLPRKILSIAIGCKAASESLSPR